MINLTILTEQKNYQDDKCRARIDYFVLFEKRDKLDAKLNIGEFKKLNKLSICESGVSSGLRYHKKNQESMAIA